MNIPLPIDQMVTQESGKSHQVAMSKCLNKCKRMEVEERNKEKQVSTKAILKIWIFPAVLKILES